MMVEKIFKCQTCGCDTTNDQSFTVRTGYVCEVHRCDACDKRWHMELDWECMGETINESNIICPYCGYEYSDYDGWSFEGGDHEEVECECCGKHFDLEVRERRTYSTKRSVCDMPDDWDGEEEY